MKNNKLKKMLIPTFREEKNTIAVYIFGSFVRNEEKEDSDLDLAILSNPGFNLDISQLREKIWSIIRIEPQIVDLRKVNLIFQQRILSEGLLIYESDYLKRADFVEKVIIEYCDFEPVYRKALADFFYGLKRKYGTYLRP